MVALGKKGNKPDRSSMIIIGYRLGYRLDNPDWFLIKILGEILMGWDGMSTTMGWFDRPLNTRGPVDPSTFAEVCRRTSPL